MKTDIRRAGRARMDDGTLLLWSVAVGHRGRRWRAMTSRDGHLLEARLLEVDGTGRPARLEITNSSGVLTLHPDPSGGLHGNVVTPDGVRHLALAWSDAHEIAVDRSPIATAVSALRLSAVVPVGDAREVEVVAVTMDLGVEPGIRHYRRVSDSTWQISGGDRTRSLTIDARGIPTWPDDRSDVAEWPLEGQTER